MPHQAAAYPSVRSKKWLGVFLFPPGWNANLLQGYPQNQIRWCPSWAHWLWRHCASQIVASYYSCTWNPFLLFFNHVLEILFMLINLITKLTASKIQLSANFFIADKNTVLGVTISLTGNVLKGIERWHKVGKSFHSETYLIVGTVNGSKVSTSFMLIGTQTRPVDIKPQISEKKGRENKEINKKKAAT